MATNLNSARKRELRTYQEGFQFYIL